MNFQHFSMVPPPPPDIDQSKPAPPLPIGIPPIPPPPPPPETPSSEAHQSGHPTIGNCVNYTHDTLPSSIPQVSGTNSFQSYPSTFYQHPYSDESTPYYPHFRPTNTYTDVYSNEGVYNVPPARKTTYTPCESTYTEYNYLKQKYEGNVHRPYRGGREFMPNRGHYKAPVNIRSFSYEHNKPMANRVPYTAHGNYRNTPAAPQTNRTQFASSSSQRYCL